jgi:uncharacterized cupredoxin-like copper-binding protein
MKYGIAAVMGLALLASLLPLPACQSVSTNNFDVMSLDVTPNKVIENDKFTVTATISNTSKDFAAYTVPVWVDGIVADKTTIMLEAGKSKEVQFTLSKPEAGTYEIIIGDKSSTVTVEKVVPAVFKLANLKINMNVANPGAEVVITADIVNTGGSEGSYTAELKINGVTEQVDKVTMEPGASFIVFKVIKTEPGAYSVGIGDLAGEFTVQKPIETTNPTPAAQQSVSQWGESPPS